jgi:Bacterial PH domain
MCVAGAAVLQGFLGSRQLKQAWPSIAPLFPHGTHFAVVTHALSFGTAILLMLAALTLLGRAALWYATWIILDDTTLTVRTPLSSNVIPLQAIQDIQTARPLPGLLFNYGTLVIYSGNETENIDYVPNVEAVAHGLYRKPGV